MKTFKDWLTTEQTGAFVYHGTTAVNAKSIEVQKILRPRGKSEGNWGHKFFGGNPSSSNLIYCTRSKKDAIDYAKEICQNIKTKDGAVITVSPNWKEATLDEDVMNELANRTNLHGDPLARKFWTVYANYLKNEFGQQVSLEQAIREFNEWVENLESGDAPDSTYSQLLINLVDDLIKLLTPQEMQELTKGTVAFKTPLPIVKVEYMRF